MAIITTKEKVDELKSEIESAFKRSRDDSTSNNPPSSDKIISNLSEDLSVAIDNFVKSITVTGVVDPVANTFSS
jgi:hypothetical protein